MGDPRGGVRGRRGQAGVAIVTAMLIVVLATTVVAGLLVRENVTVRSVENRLAMSQTRWIERAAVDWAKVILRADAVSTGAVDHLGEPWAVPVAETRLDETVTAGAKLSEATRPATLSGQIIDAQSRLNLQSLVQGGQPSQEHIAAFRKLLTLTGQPASLADVVVARLLRSVPRTVEGRTVPPTELPLLRLEDLMGLAGIDAAVLDVLRPFATVLPTPTTVNVNTAAPEVLAALLPDVDLAAARRYVSRRERTWYRSLGDASNAFDGQPVLPPGLLAVGSSHFIVRGVVRFDRVETSSETLLARNAQKVEILWQQRQ